MNHLITQEGFDKYMEEFKTLAYKEKPYWVEEKRMAAELGDRSENAEYISAKGEIRRIDKRLRFLDKIISNSNVIETKKRTDFSKVGFGCNVKLLDLDTDKEIIYQIVGTYESNPNDNLISNISPLGKLLLGKSVGDEVLLEVNKDFFEYEILEIS